MSQLDLLLNVGTRHRLDGWGEDIERLHIVMIGSQIMLHHLHRLYLLESCLLRNLVLAIIRVVLQVADIGNIADVADLIVQVRQVPE